MRSRVPHLLERHAAAGPLPGRRGAILTGMRNAHQFAAYLNGYDTEDDARTTWSLAEVQPEFDHDATARLDPLAMRWLFATKDRHVIEWTGDKWAVTGHLDDYYKDDE